jgi:hypothetical protein
MPNITDLYLEDSTAVVPQVRYVHGVNLRPKELEGDRSIAK